MIWVCSVFPCPFYRTLGINGSNCDLLSLFIYKLCCNLDYDIDLLLLSYQLFYLFLISPFPALYGKYYCLLGTTRQNYKTASISNLPSRPQILPVSLEFWTYSSDRRRTPVCRVVCRFLSHGEAAPAQFHGLVCRRCRKDYPLEFSCPPGILLIFHVSLILYLLVFIAYFFTYNLLL